MLRQLVGETSIDKQKAWPEIPNRSAIDSKTAALRRAQAHVAE